MEYEKTYFWQKLQPCYNFCSLSFTLSLMIMIFPLCLFWSEFLMLYNREVSYSAITGYWPEDEFINDKGAVNMGKFNDSFNFQLWAKNSLTDEQVDLIDNDYFELSAYRVNETTKKAHFRDPQIQFVHCPENLSRKMKSGKKEKGACIGGRDSIDLKANWVMDSFDILTITITECKNRTDNNFRCKSPEEI